MTPPEEAFNSGLTYHKAGDFARAEVCYRRAVALAPGYSDAWNNLGIIAQHARNPSVAADLYMTALRCNPKFAPAWGNLGALFENVGRYPEAAQVYEIALRLDRRPEVMSNLAGLYREMGRFEDAYRCYREAVAIGGDNLVHIHSAWVFTVDQDLSSTIEGRMQIRREFRERLG